MDSSARLMLRRAVARKAQVEKSPRIFGIEATALRAELRCDREVERELSDDGGFRADAVTNDVERLPEIVDTERHGSVSGDISFGKCDHGTSRQALNRWGC
jgi:hypothetical protein